MWTIRTRTSYVLYLKFREGFYYQFYYQIIILFLVFFSITFRRERLVSSIGNGSFLLPTGRQALASDNCMYNKPDRTIVPNLRNLAFLKFPFSSERENFNHIVYSVQLLSKPTPPQSMPSLFLPNHLKPTSRKTPRHEYKHKSRRWSFWHLCNKPDGSSYVSP